MALTNQGKRSTLWELEQKLSLPIWQNYLSFPGYSQDYTPCETRLQEELNFVFIRDTKESSKIFISEATHFSSVFQFAPFLSKTYEFYLCNDQLIKERISSYKYKKSFLSDNSTTRQLTKLLETAAAKGASDIHLESRESYKTARLRINNKLEALELSREIDERLFSKIKLISGMDIAITRSPQDGHFPFTTALGKRFDMRVSTLPAVFGEKIVVRLLAASTVNFSMKELGFNPSQIETIIHCISKKSGLILFTGPTGSGKTTSLYSILKSLNAEELNILTVEDPAEYRLEGITQVEVNETAGSSFAALLRGILRQDPDVILIGEIRDKETAQIAARAAQTGHLVFSTLHANDTFETIRRMQNLGVAHHDLASSLRLIISQRLVQKQCNCGGDTDCPDCLGTATNGRIPLMEILKITPHIQKLISRGSSPREIKEHSDLKDHQSLLEIGQKYVTEGTITQKELDTVVGF